MSNLTLSSQSIGFLVDVYAVTGANYKYQNFSQSTITWSNQQWQYLPMDYKPASRDLALEHSANTLVVPSTPPIREILENNNYFQSATAGIYYVFPDANLALFLTDYYTVQYAEIKGATINFSLDTSLSAIQGKIPSIYFSTGNSPNTIYITGCIPEAPLSDFQGLQN